MLPFIVRKPMHRLLHLIFELAAFTVGYGYFRRLRAGQGDPIPEAKRLQIIVAAAAGALLGSRALGALEDPARLVGGAWSIAIALGNRTVVGGLLGGLLAVELIKKIIGVRTSSGELFTYPLILGLMIGRVGCLLAGLDDDTYGIATDLPWGIDFGDGIRRHPTNAYEIAWLGAMWLSLRAIERRWVLANGARFELFMVLYLGFRLAVECIKPQPVVAWGLSSIQWACVAALVYYGRVWSSRRS